MKTKYQQRIEIAFFSFLSAAVGVSFGYYWASNVAAEDAAAFVSEVLK